uniref:Gustatory receptor n=1 Tax=Caenorhabditis tropicalis TaxID=1561998 RepID=A0A1I7T7Q9_9PELO
MSFRQLTQYSFLTAGIAVYAYLMLHDIPVDVRLLSSYDLRTAIESNEVCDVSVKQRGFFLQNDELSFDIVKAKFETFFSRNYLIRFLSEQVQCMHIIDEALLVVRFLLCASFMVISIFVIEFLVVRRMGNLVKNQLKVKKLESEESAEWKRCVKEYVSEKVIIVAYCIIRSFVKPIHKHYIDFGDYVRDCFALRTHSTDVTLFACWFCLLAVCHVSTNSIFRRFITTIPLLDRSLMTRLRGQFVFIVMFITLNSLFALSAILLGAAIVSFGLINSGYALILVLESFRVFIRSLYVLDRLSMSVSSSCMSGIEQQTKLKREEVATILMNGFQYSNNTLNLRNLYAASTHVINLSLNVLYSTLGLYYNRKLLAFGFLLGANQSFNDLLNFWEYNPQHLL